MTYIYIYMTVKVLVTQLCLTLQPMDCSLCPWDSPGKNNRAGWYSLLLGYIYYGMFLSHEK